MTRKPRSIIVAAKISLCVMLMTITAGVANASTISNFTFNALGSVTVTGGSTDNLAFEFVAPDAYNNGAGAEDTLVTDSGWDSWNGDTLTSFAASERFMDTNANNVYDDGEAIVNSADGLLGTNGDGDDVLLSGTAPWSNFLGAGAQSEYFFDDPVAPTVGGFDGPEAIWSDVDGDGQMSQNDYAIIGGMTSYMNFNSPPASAVGGANPATIYFGNNLMACDDGVGVFVPGEPIWADDTVAGTLGVYDHGIDTILFDSGACLIAQAGFGQGYLGTAFNGTGSDGAAYLDSNHNGVYDYSPSTLGGGSGEPIITTLSSIVDGGNISGGITGETVLLPYNESVINSELGIGGTFDNDWYLMSASGDNHYLETVAGPAGYQGDESVIVDANSNSLLDDSEIQIGAIASTTKDMDTTWTTNKFAGTGAYNDTYSIYMSADGILNKIADQLDDLTLMNSGTMLQTDIAAVNLYADANDNGIFEPGAADGGILSVGAWDGDSWVLNTAIEAVPALGQRFFVSVDLVASPAAGATIKLYIPQLSDPLVDGDFDAGDEGLFMASINDGPTDANGIPVGISQLATAVLGGGGSGGAGGASNDCGDGIVTSNETCDDGNRSAGDGCSVYCSLEDGYVWDSASGTVALEGSETTVTEETPVEEIPVDTTVVEEEVTEADKTNVADNFSDYDSTHWAANYITKMYNSGIMTGLGDGTFGVAIGTTRAEIVKIALLSNGIEVPASVDVAPFKDTPVSEWYTPYVTKAVELGIVDGYDDGNFRPGNTVNRAEALKILLLAKGVDVTGMDLSMLNFSDVSDSIWYAAYVAYAVDNGLIEGYEDGTFKGGNDILRAEIAKLAVLIMLLEM